VYTKFCRAKFCILSLGGKFLEGNFEFLKEKSIFCSEKLKFSSENLQFSLENSNICPQKLGFSK